MIFSSIKIFKKNLQKTSHNIHKIYTWERYDDYIIRLKRYRFDMGSIKPYQPSYSIHITTNTFFFFVCLPRRMELMNKMTVFHYQWELQMVIIDNLFHYIVMSCGMFHIVVIKRRS